ncbi:DEAD-box ATP-dependent RNA helicase 42 [Diospyros lotus]|uniref:DEAD-box ATP-dependent RNA helicase 42 n=1 Tax=Diospyros lotus TaxID=55363 RepID=UPI002251891B|nr:DEAD-box ATP-dependent RNA helicase 42 [Diospyros lotus]XP_052184839.1 DEAD-box ATP-dependent RNA helicase 42 [Diospyros lotus]XP_052184840.1 DEAD-box ATP-dependent RNA helicase 42 [Diospyros lotus]XP_052184841.1 DEAD-box ATP-dependent RNA helicase 42 [Diospyros lotus]XP_052184842.1 DEAD-box ATP-dependent RNA helicase 42 [Diospyros lotus]XP_052184843.1 DEAD-box ATP-dependent RNA helicase 42 [Diospyros lotus]XP_052184844.1 DEAD-box ATP-dependent RNA helicase 42 [Diospyros lotus]
MEETKHKSCRKEDSEGREDSKSRSHRKDESGSKEDLKTRSHRSDWEDSEIKEESKSRSLRRDRGDRERDGVRKSDKDRDRHRDSSDKRKDRRSEREKSADDDKYSERESRRSERERSVDEKHREREKNKDRHRDRDKDKDKKRRQEEDRTRDRDRAKDKERDREDRVEADRERKREREEREKRDRERDRAREREKEREKRERDRIRERDKFRDVSSDDDEGDVMDRKRRRKEEDSRERERGRSSRSKRNREDGEDSSPRKRSDEDLSEKKEVRTREEDLEEEQRKLDEEMEKRRRRVQEWQELRRKKEESEREKLGVTSNADEPTAGKTWTLEGESDDEEPVPEEKTGIDINSDGDVRPMDEDGVPMVVDSQNGAWAAPAPQNDGDGASVDEEIDPLDAFMNSMVLPEVEKLNTAVVPSASEGKSSNLNKDKSENQTNGVPRKGLSKSIGRIIPGEDSDSDYGEIEKDEDAVEDEDDDEFMKRVKKTKAEKLSIVDHSKIEYPPFRKNFYIEVKEISRMTSEEVAAYRKQLELKIHGKDVPKPIKTWHQIGLSTKILETIKKLNYEKPMPIQAQALPIIMSGRDCIGIAKTGSGKTLAFVLPMLRHIKDQPPLVSGDGPIGVIMAPTRELVQQIHSDIKKFTKVMGLTCVPVYGGSGVAQQISELKRGAEIVVCTPGRMIDILCTSGGKITNLRRVTYLVMDEADRMFDMGFEPQITRIVQNTRPDRQTVLFSATFPRQVEILARKVLNKPVEIQVGGRSVVNKDIAQLVEVRPENERFLRLLELLGEWYEKGKILIFVHTQEKCDALFRDLIKHGYPCLSLHGGKDQTDRESTISDFKSNVCNLLTATSVAARGLDVKELELVINFDVPNHYEDYVHRVGRTGRAGRKGCAITFISEEDARYAPDLVKALELSEQVVPDDLKALADGFMAKVNQGLEQAHGTGYGGSGFKFNEEEDEVRRAAKKAQAREYGFEEDKSDSDDEDEGIKKAGGDFSQQAILAQAAALAAASKVSVGTTPASAVQLLPNAGLPVSLPGVLGLTIPGAAAVVPGAPVPITAGDGAARAAALAAAMNLQHNLAKLQADAMPEHYQAELEINDFPQNARWKVTHKETLGPISEWTGAAITTRGQYFPPGKIPGPGERKLYLFIEGPTEQSVKRAKAELKRVLEDITSQALSLPGSGQPGRYSVL